MLQMALIGASSRSIADASAGLDRGWRRGSGQRHSILPSRHMERRLTLAGQERGEIELNGMTVDSFGGNWVGEDVGCAVRQSGVGALGVDAHSHWAFAIEVDGDDSAAGNRTVGDEAKIEQQLYGVSRRQPAGRGPLQTRPIAGENLPRHLLGVAGVDGRAERACGAEGETAELEARRGRNRALLDELHGHGPHLFVLLAVEHFKAIDDRPDRADHVVAYPRAQERGEVERSERGYCQAADPGFDIGLMAAGRRATPPRRSPSVPCLSDSSLRRDARLEMRQTS